MMNSKSVNHLSHHVHKKLSIQLSVPHQWLKIKKSLILLVRIMMLFDLFNVVESKVPLFLAFSLCDFMDLFEKKR